jgi:hypothetical protein
LRHARFLRIGGGGYWYIFTPFASAFAPDAALRRPGMYTLVAATCHVYVGR